MAETDATKAAKAWFPYFFSGVGVLGSIVGATITYYQVMALESGEAENAVIWKISAFFYEIGGLWFSLAPYLVLLLSSLVATIKFRTKYLALRSVVGNEEFKEAKRKIEQKKADESHIFGGKTTTIRQFLLVLLFGIILTGVFFAWLITRT